MNTVTRLIAIFAIVLASGCGREPVSPQRIVSDSPASPPEIADSRWVFDPGELRAATLQAFGNPLVQSFLPRRDDPRLGLVADHVIRAEGRLSDGSPARLTVLPYCVDGDSSHASFITLLERADRMIAEMSELIVGREPTSLEEGFEPIALGTRIAWIRGGGALLAAGASAAGRAPTRLNRAIWLGCFLANAGTWCEAGGSIARQIAPSVPSAYAIGCTAGTAAAAIFCVAVASK